jgi:hypothetical protein
MSQQPTKPLSPTEQPTSQRRAVTDTLMSAKLEPPNLTSAHAPAAAAACCSQQHHQLPPNRLAQRSSPASSAALQTFTFL